MDALKTKAVPLAIALGVLAVYLALPTQNYYWDGIGFSQTIEDASRLAPSLLHPNHLIYTAAGYLEYRAVQALGLQVRALTVLRIANSILSAAAAYLVFGLLQSSFGSVYLSSALTLLFSFSATWWKFSTDANAYVPAVFLMLIAIRAAGMASPESRSARPVLAALAHTGAMLFHELAVLIYPAIALSLYLRSPQTSARQRLWSVLRYSVPVFLFTFSSYYAGFCWVRRSGAIPGGSDWRAFFSWLTYSSPDAAFSWNMSRGALLSLRGTLQLFLGGRVAWAIRQWPWICIPLMAVMLALIAALVFRCIKFRGPELTAPGASRPIARGSQALIVALPTWLAAYLLFLFFWLPANTFYRLFYLPALILILGGALARRARANRRVHGTALLVSIVAAWNLAFYIFPNSRVESSPPLQFAQAMKREWPPGTGILYGTFNTDDWTIRYFHPETVWRKWDPAELSLLDSELQRSAPGAGIWLDTTAADLLQSIPGGSDWLQRHSHDSARFELVNSQHRIVFQKIVPGH